MGENMFMAKEPRGVFFLIDNKSFYASCEAVERGFNPLKVPLVVMSEAPNTNGGLVLATSPEAKALFHLKANVSRQRDLPRDPRLMVVPPRMNLYIKKNLQINRIFARFTSEAEVWPYSIDESILDMTHSWQLFGQSPRAVARVIQTTIRRELGLYTTVGIGDNPVQAKLALDIYAKHQADLIGEIHFETVPQKIWTIPNLTDVWGIGERTAKHLRRLQIHSVYELAHTNPYELKQALGVIGLQLFATVWGVDRSKITDKPIPKATSIGNSQVLPRDYRTQIEIETVIKEISEQVAARLRHQHKLTSCLTLGVGFSYAATAIDGRSGFQQAIKIRPTNDHSEITKQLLWLFNRNWEEQAVRHLDVYCSRLSPDSGQQLDLFSAPTTQIKHYEMNQVIDQIQQRFGFSKLVYAKSLLAGGTAINRSQLVGGHNGGNSYE